MSVAVLANILEVLALVASGVSGANGEQPTREWGYHDGNNSEKEKQNAALRGLLGCSFLVFPSSWELIIFSHLDGPNKKRIQFDRREIPVIGSR